MALGIVKDLSVFKTTNPFFNYLNIILCNKIFSSKEQRIRKNREFLKNIYNVSVLAIIIWITYTYCIEYAKIPIQHIEIRIILSSLCILSAVFCCISTFKNEYCNKKIYSTIYTNFDIVYEKLDSEISSKCIQKSMTVFHLAIIVSMTTLCLCPLINGKNLHCIFIISKFIFIKMDFCIFQICGWLMLIIIRLRLNNSQMCYQYDINVAKNDKFKLRKSRRFIDLSVFNEVYVLLYENMDLIQNMFNIEVKMIFNS